MENSEPRKSILIVDDDPVHLRIYSLILEREGYQTVPLQVQHTFPAIPEHPIDLVVLDYVLSGVRAADVANRLHSQLPHCPILLLSDVYGLPADVEPYVQAFVRKGDPQRLVLTVAKLLKSPSPQAEAVRAPRA